MASEHLIKNVSGAQAVLPFAAVALVSLICLAINRLYLSPLARYPGPVLAALTQFVETYYELRGDGGQFVFKIDKWHEQYGRLSLGL